MATVNYKCPNCGGPLKFNPDKQMFSCEYCLSDFSEKKIQELYAEQEKKENSTEKQEKNQEQEKSDAQTKNQEQQEDAVVYTCPSCGAEVITTASTAATTCFYCQNPVVLGGRLSGEFKPDKIIPFALSKESAIEKFIAMCKKKKFLPKGFASKKQFDKMTGVYFPYWYVDEQKFADATARGEKYRTWEDGDNIYTETQYFKLIRSGDFVIKNVFERALKSEDREMLQCVHPFDLTKAQTFSMSYLSGFQAEKRDIEKKDIENDIENRMQDYCKMLLKNSMNDYSNIKFESYKDNTELTSWNYNLLPVWVVTYKYKNKIFPFAINGQTGKTYGKLPISLGKLALFGAGLFVILSLLGFVGGLIFL